MGSLNLKYILYVKWLCDIMKHLYCYGVVRSINNSLSSCVVGFSEGGMSQVSNIVRNNNSYTQQKIVYIVLMFTSATKVTENINIHCDPIYGYCFVLQSYKHNIITHCFKLLYGFNSIT